MRSQASGLVDKLEEICEPGNLLETSHPDVEKSFRFHHWKDRYGEILCKWTKEKITWDDYVRVSVSQQWKRKS